jgi:hypothetical protein
VTPDGRPAFAAPSASSLTADGAAPDRHGHHALRAVVGPPTDGTVSGVTDPRDLLFTHRMSEMRRHALRATVFAAVFAVAALLFLLTASVVTREAQAESWVLVPGAVAFVAALGFGSMAHVIRSEIRHLTLIHEAGGM